MSDTTQAPQELELIADDRRTRFDIVITVLLLVNLVATVGFGLLGVRDRHQAQPGTPKPSHSATSTPSPRPSTTSSAPSPSTSATPSNPMPTMSGTPDPTDSNGCNIFDAECQNGGSDGPSS